MDLILLCCEDICFGCEVFVVLVEIEMRDDYHAAGIATSLKNDEVRRLKLECFSNCEPLICCFNKTCLVGLGKRIVYGNTPNERCVLFVMDVSASFTLLGQFSMACLAGTYDHSCYLGAGLNS